jgi:hypothetical protein
VVFKPYPCNHFTPRGRGRRPAAARPGARPRRRHSDRAGRRQARPAHDRRATRGQGTEILEAARSPGRTVAVSALGIRRNWMRSAPR